MNATGEGPTRDRQHLGHASTNDQSPITDSHALVCDLGTVEYGEAWELQRRLQRQLIDARRADRPAPHVLLFVEHPPVYTLGPSGDPANVLLAEPALRARGASYFRTDRGGDVTFHGPGQIVAYPIVDLERVRYTDGSRGTDMHRYLRALEEAVIHTCAEYGVEAGRVGGRTGVWVGPDDRRTERKICAMGIRCSRWVTMHGLAFNVHTDTSWFDLIVPCGIADRGVTTLAAETGGEIDIAEVRGRLAGHLLEALGLEGMLVGTEHVSQLLPAPAAKQRPSLPSDPAICCYHPEPRGR
jgi:lipoyl(octanoyl) transferase